MGKSFGVIPLSTLRKYEGPETKNQPICDPLELHKFVKRFGWPNFLGARVPVVSNLKMDNWKFHLRDTQLLDVLEFGFPPDFDTTTELISTEENHASAKQFSSHVQLIFGKNINMGSYWDHLNTSPFHFASHLL